MAELTLDQFNKDRKSGYRPSVLCCCINDGKLLFLNKREYGLWMLPQGRVENGEQAEQSVLRAVEEELGKKFLSKLDKELIPFGQYQLEFPEKRHGIDELKTDEGEDVLLIGKKFYFFAVAALTSELDLTETEFDDYFWLTYDTGMALAAKIYQVNKRAMTEEVLKLLKSKELIS